MVASFLSKENQLKPPPHGKIVKEILPIFAEKLRKEAVITGYNQNPFILSIVAVNLL
jgi:hypothetical protein